MVTRTRWEGIVIYRCPFRSYFYRGVKLNTSVFFIFSCSGMFLSVLPFLSIQVMLLIINHIFFCPLPAITLENHQLAVGGGSGARAGGWHRDPLAQGWFGITSRGASRRTHV